jgi:hypothetical protein
METQLTLNDIASVINIIDAVSTRGAFRGEELAEIGTLRNKFATFLQDAQLSETELQELPSVDEYANSAEAE